MKKIVLFLALIALLLFCTSCLRAAGESSQPESTPPNTQPEGASQVTSSEPDGQEPGELSEAPSQLEEKVVPPEGSKSASLFIPDKNQQNVQFSIYIPEKWEVIDGTIFEDGRRVAQFTMVETVSDMDAYFEGLDAKHPDTVHSAVSETVGIDGKYYHFQTQEEGSTSFDNELVFYVRVRDRVATLSFYPAFGIGIFNQREEFERYLATLDIRS